MKKHWKKVALAVAILAVSWLIWYTWNQQEAWLPWCNLGQWILMVLCTVVIAFGIWFGIWSDRERIWAFIRRLKIGQIIGIVLLSTFFVIAGILVFYSIKNSDKEPPQTVAATEVKPVETKVEEPAQETETAREENQEQGGQKPDNSGNDENRKVPVTPVSGKSVFLGAFVGICLLGAIGYALRKSQPKKIVTKAGSMIAYPFRQVGNVNGPSLLKATIVTLPVFVLINYIVYYARPDVWIGARGKEFWIAQTICVLLAFLWVSFSRKWLPRISKATFVAVLAVIISLTIAYKKPGEIMDDLKVAQQRTAKTDTKVEVVKAPKEWLLIGENTRFVLRNLQEVETVDGTHLTYYTWSQYGRGEIGKTQAFREASATDTKFVGTFRGHYPERSGDVILEPIPGRPGCYSGKSRGKIQGTDFRNGEWQNIEIRPY